MNAASSTNAYTRWNTPCTLNFGLRFEDSVILVDDASETQPCKVSRSTKLQARGPLKSHITVSPADNDNAGWAVQGWFAGMASPERHGTACHRDHVQLRADN